jgi:hypothetical protein
MNKKGKQILKTIDKISKNVDDLNKPSESHIVWHKFEKWLQKTFGKDLYGKPTTLKIGKKTVKMQSYNEAELYRRLAGYEVMCKIERYVAKFCPEIKIIRCDDSSYAGSDILLIPHPDHGITVMFIPQCTSIQNTFFLYGNHHKMLMTELKKMKAVYKKRV